MNNLIQIPTYLSLQNFVHVTIPVLPWHLQKILVIWWPGIDSQNKISLKFDFDGKIVKQACGSLMPLISLRPIDAYICQ